MVIGCDLVVAQIGYNEIFDDINIDEMQNLEVSSGKSFKQGSLSSSFLNNVDKNYSVVAMVNIETDRITYLSEEANSFFGIHE